MVGILFQPLHFPVFISSACKKKLQIVDGSGAVDNDERDWHLSHTEKLLVEVRRGGNRFILSWKIDMKDKAL